MRAATGLIVVLSLRASAAFGQQAQLSGLVQDTSGGAMTAVSVTLLNQDNGIRRATVTNGEGVYALPSLQPGTYRVTVRKEGFRSLVRTGLRLEVGQSARVDFSLPVGNVEEVITIESAPLWATGEAGSVGTLVRRDFVEQLPVSGRGLLTMLELSPGLVVSPVLGSLEAGQFSVNGLRPNANQISIDGASANFGVQDDAPGYSLGGNLPAASAIGSLHSLASLAAVEEFRVDAASAPAETGRFAGAHLMLATRAGGNSWHGSLQHFFRNEKLDANSWFANLIGQRRAPIRWNNPGATLGGPVARDRTFLFASYESFRLRQPEDLAIQVPTEAERQLVSGALSKALIALYPLPTFSPVPEVALFLGRTAQPARLDSASLRIDHRLSARWLAFSRFHVAPSASDRGLTRAALSSSASLRHDSYVPLQTNTGVGLTLDTNTYFDLRASYSRMSIDGSISPFGGGDLAALFGSSTGRSWSVQAAGWSALQRIRGIRRTQAQWQAVPALSAVRGRHQLKLGGDLRLLRPEIAEPEVLVNALFFTPGALDEGGGSFANVTARAPLRLRFWNVSAYLQDSWKLHSSLTINYGIRWEWNPPPVTRDALPIQGVVAGLNDGTGPRLSPPGAPVWPRRHRDFAPRVALAYRAPRGFVLRAGTGVHYSLLAGGVLEALRSQPASLATAEYAGVPLAGLSQLAAPAFGRLTTSSPVLSAYAEDLRSPLALQSNVTVETAAGRAGTVSAGWVSALGRRLLRGELSSVEPGAAPFRFLQLATGHGSSNYHAFQARYRSGLSGGGAQWMASYAWSHAIDNGSRDGEIGLPELRKLDRGNADFDIRHSFTLAFLIPAPDRAAKALLRGWNLGGFLRARSGFPFYPVISGGLDQSPGLNYEAVVPYRPDFDSTKPVWLQDGRIPGGRGLNPAAFPLPRRPRLGTLGRNSIGGFFFHQVDLSVHRTFRLPGSSASLDVRVDAFNAFNRPNLNAPALAAVSGFADPPYFAPSLLVSQYMGRFGSGGDPSSGLLSQFQIGGPRSTQLSVRIAF